MSDTRSQLRFDCMIHQQLRKRHGVSVNDAYLRKPYQYTKAEPQDNTQEKLHEFDYRKAWEDK